jgi:sigma-54 dependent tetracycline resistance transcriptional regulator
VGDGFRQDLYYRLAHAVFVLPPLRSRGDDTGLLIEHFLEMFSNESRKRVHLSNAARERLVGYTGRATCASFARSRSGWSCKRSDGQVVTPRDIPLSDSAEAPRNFSEEMGSQEKARILEALEKTHYIKADAARTLRISRTTLLGKMKRYGIPG